MIRKNTKKWAKRELAILTRKLDENISKEVRKQSKTCYTCEIRLAAHCGHFVRRAIMGTRFDPDNLRPQCAYFNTFLFGNLAEYSARLIGQMGEERFKALIARSRKIRQWTAQELKALLAAIEIGWDEYVETYKKLTP